MNEPYRYWAEKIAGNDPDPPADRTVLPCGFWRLRDGLPLAVWPEDDGLVAVKGFASNSAQISRDAMEAMAERGGFGIAVTEDDYRAAMMRGFWPDSEGPSRDLMNELRTVATGFTDAADQIAVKLSLYPDYRLTKKLANEIIKWIATAGGALNTYQEKTNVERDAA